MARVSAPHRHGCSSELQVSWLGFRHLILTAAGALCVAAAASLVLEDAGWAAVAGLGFRGAVGAVFAAHYFGRGRWLLQFPGRAGESNGGFLDALFDYSQIEIRGLSFYA